MKSRQTDQEYRADAERLQMIRQSVDELHIMRTCEWNEIKKAERRKRREDRIKLDASYKFLGQGLITESSLVQAVKEGSFYGILKIDIETTECVIKEYSHLNGDFFSV